MFGGKHKRSITILKVIKQNPGLNITEISEKSNTKREKVSIYLAAFRENQWTQEQIASPEKFIYLTNAGEVAYKQLKALTGAKAGMIGKALKYI